jgi:hypothetical protein
MTDAEITRLCAQESPSADSHFGVEFAAAYFEGCFERRQKERAAERKKLVIAGAAVGTALALYYLLKG